MMVQRQRDAAAWNAPEQVQELGAVQIVGGGDRREAETEQVPGRERIRHVEREVAVDRERGDAALPRRLPPSEVHERAPMPDEDRVGREPGETAIEGLLA